jgi:RNA polymerase sigma factor (sigma-70 family)
LSEPEAAAVRREEHDLLWDAIGQLQPRQKRLLIARHWLGMTLREIAETEGCTHQAIERALSVTVRKLSVLLYGTGLAVKD